METARKLLISTKSVTKKAPSAYILFGNEARKTAEIALIEGKSRMSAIAAKWKEVDAATKARLEAESAALKEASKAAPAATVPSPPSFPLTVKFKTEDEFDKKMQKIVDAAVVDYMKALATNSELPITKTAQGQMGNVIPVVEESGKVTITFNPKKGLLDN